MVGTRPEAIKTAPVAQALSRRGFIPRLVLTGQHADLDPADHDLGGYPALRLRCAGMADPDAHAHAVAAALKLHFGGGPDLLVVQGDTSSAYGGALSGYCAGVAVAHVEAGLRSHDPAMPWPEEGYRTAIDAQAELLFAPTELAAANLKRERVPGAIFVTGNSGIDAFLGTLDALPPQRVRDRGLPRLLVTCHRRENWGEGLRSLAEALRTLAADGLARIDVLLHPNAHVSAAIHGLLGGRHGISLLPPCSHRELAAHMRDCDLMLSDSGGVQEEAPAIGLPLLVLREKTERPEAIATGNMRLVGTDSARIQAAVRSLLADPVELAAMARPSLPYGDGRAGERMASIIESWCAAPAERRAQSSPDLHRPW